MALLMNVRAESRQVSKLGEVGIVVGSRVGATRPTSTGIVLGRCGTQFGANGSKARLEADIRGTAARERRPRARTVHTLDTAIARKHLMTRLRERRPFPAHMGLKVAPGRERMLQAEQSIVARFIDTAERSVIRRRLGSEEGHRRSVHRMEGRGLAADAAPILRAIHR